MMARTKHCLVYCMALAILVAYSFSPAALTAFAVEGEEVETVPVEQAEEATEANTEVTEVVPEADQGEKSEPTEVTDAQTEKAGPSEEVEVIEKDTVSALAEVTSIEENASEEALIVLKAIIPEDGSSGHQYGKDIEVVTLDKTDLDQNFTGTVQEALYNAKSENNITRIIIPDGEYQPSGRALEIYSNTILDLRGSGAETPYDTSDDYDNVIIYQSTIDNDPPSLRCGHQDANGGDNSYDYGFYNNITVLGGTFVGEWQNENPQTGATAQTRATAGNLRFGHATNINIIGTKIRDNYGGHHLEIGACKDILVADCIFSGYHDVEESDISQGLSLEAIQLDVSHREKNNFAYFGAHDDLPVINATITGCTFDNVRRGVGTHHAVFGHPYDNITVTNNTFTNIRDKAIYFVYTKNANISKNTIENAVSGISFQYLVPSQQFQPNNGVGKVTKPTDLATNTKIENNTIRLDDTKALDTKLEGADAKYGIRVGGTKVTAAQGKTNGITEGIYRITGVETIGNDIGITSGKGSLKMVRAGILEDYVSSCPIRSNKIDMGGYNEPYDPDNGKKGSGIFVSDCYNVAVTRNEVRGITNGAKTDSILITSCGGAQVRTIYMNKVYNAARYGIHCYNTKNENYSVWTNEVYDAKVCGIKLTNSKMKNVTTNTVKMTGSTKMTEPGISITGSTAKEVSYNKISGTADSGLLVSQSSTVQKANSNTITSPGKHGIIAYDGSKITYVNSNAINSAKQFGILASSKASSKAYIYQAKSNTISKPGATGIAATGGSTIKYITSNTVTSPTKNGIMIYDSGSYSESIYGNKVTGGAIGVLVDNSAKAYLIQANTLKSCKNRGIINNAWVNAIVSNTCSSCGNNAVYIKKGLSLKKYQMPITKGKTATVTWHKANATKSGATYSTSNKKIATVTSKGVVKGVGKGTCWIYAKRDKVTVKAKVTVK
ncbi:MAG: right-handed parallel beta-helix repeat-containing protein [Firmicutes bacterium]|nr:right-handed parallel beta-helix repeat-containing protein [Bacillota bacterium]